MSDLTDARERLLRVADLVDGPIRRDALQLQLELAALLFAAELAEASGYQQTANDLTKLIQKLPGLP